MSPPRRPRTAAGEELGQQQEQDHHHALGRVSHNTTATETTTTGTFSGTGNTLSLGSYDTDSNSTGSRRGMRSRRRQTVILACKLHDMSPGNLADLVLNNLDLKHEHVVNQPFIVYDNFPDGTPNITMKSNIATRIGADLSVVFIDFCDIKEFAHCLGMMAVGEKFRRQSEKGGVDILVLPYFPTATFEREDHPDQVSTALPLAKLINTIIVTGTMIVVDPHSFVVQQLLNPSGSVTIVSALPLYLENVMRELMRSNAQDNNTKTCVAFPDDGALKRFVYYVKDIPGLEIIVFGKRREGNDRLLTIREGDPRNKHVVIIDDLVQSGGTLVSCKDSLAAEGARHVDCFVTHAVFPGQSWKNIKAEVPGKGPASGFREFWTTNTIQKTATALHGVSPFRVLDVSELLADTINDFATVKVRK